MRVSRLALEEVDVVGHVEVALRVLVRDAQLQLVAGVLRILRLVGVGVGFDFDLDLVCFDGHVLAFARPRLALAHSLSDSNFSPW